MKKEFLSIPNLLGYLRILLIPVFLVLYYEAETVTDYGIAFAVLVFALLTDFFDGKIARKFHMVTDFGKALDPVADKLVQGSVAVAVCFRYPNMLVFLAVFLAKEIYMAIMGLYLIKVKSFWTPAQWYGKVCTAIIDVAVFALLLLPKIPNQAANGIILGMVLCVLFSLVKYIRFHINFLKEKELEKG